MFFGKASSAEIEGLIKVLQRNLQDIVLVRVKMGSMLVAWLAVVFVHKDNSLRRAVDIKAIKIFLKAPDFD